MGVWAPSDAEWTAARIATLPPSWQERELAAWKKRAAFDYYGANAELRETTETLLALRIPLDASDATICDAASTLADRCASRAEIFHDGPSLRLAMERICRNQGIEPPPAKVRVGPAMARMCCPLWWRRKLRRHHGQTVEGAAIRLGYVSKAKDLYISQERLTARIQQHARNAAALESTIARNELGQEYTLAQLAAKGPANKKVRRAELMTRISGFERIAVEMGHSGLFFTITLPSRFHKCRTVADGRKVLDNPNYDPTETPAKGQKALAKTWARIRAALARRGVKLYGFRIAEPQHDGTPHWHILAFHEPLWPGKTVRNAHARICALIRRYALADSPDERGAREHRCDFERIDWGKGSAAGYVAKYVSKNIDGAHVGEDFNGGPATETAARVEAWASLWGIRQFQQIGGPPVGVWRELRRVVNIPDGAPEHLVKAHRAVNKLTKLEGRENASVAWDHYCQAQGGVLCGRNAAIKLTMVAGDKPGRYGDDPAARPVGVETVASELYYVLPGLMSQRLVTWAVESVRHEWTISRGLLVENQARLTGRPVWEVPAERAQPAQPWTRVNNCTDPKRSTRRATRPVQTPCGPHEHAAMSYSHVPTLGSPNLQRIDAYGSPPPTQQCYSCP
jgi:hypothetical protein